MIELDEAHRAPIVPARGGETSEGFAWIQGYALSSPHSGVSQRWD